MTACTRVTELAVMDMRPDRAAGFEAAFAGVADLLASAGGYLGHRLIRSVDSASVYLLEVEWVDLASHVESFERSPEHARFMAALEPFLATDPRVIHLPVRGHHV